MLKLFFGFTFFLWVVGYLSRSSNHMVESLNNTYILSISFLSTMFRCVELRILHRKIQNTLFTSDGFRI